MNRFPGGYCESAEIIYSGPTIVRVAGDRELAYWRGELLRRLDAFPLDEWDAGLARAVVGVMDLACEPIPVCPEPRRLRLVH